MDCCPLQASLQACWGAQLAGCWAAPLKVLALSPAGLWGRIPFFLEEN